MVDVKIVAGLSSFVLAIALGLGSAARAQDDGALHVQKLTVNAEAKNPEACLEFDKSLAPATQAQLAATLKLESNGRRVVPANIVATGSSLCLFPLERNQVYRLSLKGLRGANDQSLKSPYLSSFIIPNRTSSLAFTNEGNLASGFGSYSKPLTLRSVNVAHARIDVYKVTDISSMSRLWQDRAMTSLAPSESAMHARTKGLTVWRGKEAFEGSPNTAIEHKFSFREKLPDLPPGLYLAVATAGDEDKRKDENKTLLDKGLAPLAAAWFTNSAYTLRAIKDSEGIHAFVSGAPEGKNAIRILAFSSGDEPLAETTTDSKGLGFIPYPPKLANKADVVSLIALDDAGNVAFANAENVPSQPKTSIPDVLKIDAPFAPPLTMVNVALPLPKKEALKTNDGFLRLSREAFVYGDFPVPTKADPSAKLSFPAPALPGTWTLRWQKTNGDVLAETSLRVTNHPDVAHLEVAAERNNVPSDRNVTLTIKSTSAIKKTVPLIGGHIFASWQKREASAPEWKDYRFGNPPALAPTPKPIADFLTDLDGAATVRIMLPPPPSEQGLYQAEIRVVSEPDSGIADAAPLFLPLHRQDIVIGAKPLATDARFPQNGLARFALIGISSEGKAQDVSGLSYQIYEEGRSFEWYQDEGRWKYKPEAHLRPVGGGPLTVKADGSSAIEWPVTAGNYRLVLLNEDGKILLRTAFSAGWDSTAAPSGSATHLHVSLPKKIQANREAVVRVFLPESALLTVFVSDAKIRKIIREIRPKGDNVVAFVPEGDWGPEINVSVEASPQSGAMSSDSLRRGSVKTTVSSATKKSASNFSPSGLFVTALDAPSGLLLRKDASTALTFIIGNDGPTPENLRYAFSASPGLKIEDAAEGLLAIKNKQSGTLTVTLSALTVGTKELKLDIVPPYAPRFSQTWNLEVRPKEAFLRTTDENEVKPRQNLIPANAKPHKGATVLLSRLSTDGWPEILSYVFNALPFTTREIALNLEALRLNRPLIEQIGLAPAYATIAKEQTLLIRLLRRQNTDGGFGTHRDEPSSITDTAAALTALGSRQDKDIAPAKDLAIAWLKQQLSNTWFDEKEREGRAAAFAALAAADAIDAASLHYFSDTSAQLSLPALAEAQLAAAFKKIKEPNAAAFWIKKMLDGKEDVKTSLVLNALAATDALPSDDVLKATAKMGARLRKNERPNLDEAAALLGAAAANFAASGKGSIASKNETHSVSGLLALPLANAVAFRNEDSQSLHLSYVLAEKGPTPSHILSRHIYRMNGVELAPSIKPTRGEIYVVEIKGDIARPNTNAAILAQMEDIGMRPLGCPLSAKLETLPFIPWISARDLSPVQHCELTAHGLNLVFDPWQNDKNSKASISTAFFAHLDVSSTNDLAPAQHRLLYPKQ